MAKDHYRQGYIYPCFFKWYQSKYERGLIYEL